MLLAKNSVLQASRAVTAQQLLKEHEHAVYTAAVVKHGRYFLSWPQHVERLLRCFTIMMGHLDPDRNVYQHQITKEQISDRTLPSLLKCLEAWQPAEVEAADANFSALIVVHPDLSAFG